MIPLAPALFALLPRDVATRPPLPAGAADAANQLSSGGQQQTAAAWLTSLIPANPIAAAATGAMVPLIVFTLLFALAIARSPAPSRTAMLGFFRALADAMLVMVRWIISLAPIGIFALVLPLAAHVGAGLAGAIGFYVAAYSIGCLFVIALLYPVVAVFGGIPIRRFARAALPAQLIAFSSSSSIASLPALVESAEHGLGLPKRVTGFVLPLAVSTFKPTAGYAWVFNVFFVATLYGIPFGPAQLALAAGYSVLFNATIPGIPGGGMIVISPMLLALGLPLEGLAIMMAVNPITDRFSTIGNVAADMAMTAILAARAGRG